MLIAPLIFNVILKHKVLISIIYGLESVVLLQKREYNRRINYLKIYKNILKLL